MFTDPDLNLNRIARRLTLPARDVSRPINEKTGQNLSQYVDPTASRWPAHCWTIPTIP